MKSYEERRAEEREERRRYENDVFYEVWRSGGNTDRINYDRVDDDMYRGIEAEDSAARILRAQRANRRSEEDEVPDGWL